MGRDPKILDDMARVAGGAVNILSGVQQQIRDDVKARVDDMADRLDLVPRADLDHALLMIKALEERVSALEKPSKKTPAKKQKEKKPLT
jgi:BMFP domain-containing protein YqiC